jgi:hypothetical protein
VGTSVPFDGKGVLVHLPRFEIRHLNLKQITYGGRIYRGGLSDMLGGEERGRGEWDKVGQGL